MKTLCTAPARPNARASATGSLGRAWACAASGSAARKSGEYGYRASPGRTWARIQAAGAATADGVVRGSLTAVGASAATTTVATATASRGGTLETPPETSVVQTGSTKIRWRGETSSLAR